MSCRRQSAALVTAWSSAPEVSRCFFPVLVGAQVELDHARLAMLAVLLSGAVSAGVPTTADFMDASATLLAGVSIFLESNEGRVAQDAEGTQAAVGSPGCAGRIE